MGKSSRKAPADSRPVRRRIRIQQTLFMILAVLVIASFVLSLVSTF